MIETDSNAYHCEDCEVCIEDYDHHCVFFSKCIGGGNINFFWGSMGGVLFNFVNIAILIAVTAAVNGGLDHNKSPKAKHNIIPKPDPPIEPVKDLSEKVDNYIETKQLIMNAGIKPVHASDYHLN